MRRYARSLTRDDTLADDVVQEALLKAIEKKESFRAGGVMKKWLFAIVHNVFISGKRRERAEARRDDRLAATIAEPCPPVGSVSEQGELLAQIAQGFARLPEHQREILRLVVVEGRSYQEAADMLDLPIGTVMSRLNRARVAMREGDSGWRGGRSVPLRLVGGGE